LATAGAVKPSDNCSKAKSPQDHAHLLNAGSQKLPKLLLIFG
jgi:hypothetical protein